MILFFGDLSFILLIDHFKLLVFFEREVILEYSLDNLDQNGFEGITGFFLIVWLFFLLSPFEIIKFSKIAGEFSIDDSKLRLNPGLFDH